MPIVTGWHPSALRDQKEAARFTDVLASTIVDDVAAGGVDHCADVMWSSMPQRSAYTRLGVVGRGSTVMPSRCRPR